MPHVPKKILKTIKPSLADGNPSTAIMFILWMIGILTTFLHMYPRCEFGCFTEAMGNRTCSERFSVETPAGFGSSTQKIATENRNRFTTFTLAYPGRILLGSIAEPNHREPSVFFSNHINRHNPLHQQYTIALAYSAVKVPHA